MSKLFAAVLYAASLMFSQAAQAQEGSPPPTFKTEELDQMLAPIALFPDEVLSNVLMSSTYPLEVVQAARWRKESSNGKLKGDALSKALEPKDWDPSIKALTQFPDILQMMSDQLEWTQKLGDAFIAQEDDVFARIQFLRQKADEAGNLTSNEQQTVTKQQNPTTQTSYIAIEQPKPDVVYVPVYQPTIAYGSWWYPTYPPYYWNWYPGSTLVSGFFWGTGFAIANSLWGWNDFDWNRGDIDIDVNRYNNINVNREKITSNKWQHDPKHRGAVPYRDKASREKFAKTDTLTNARQDFRGYDKGPAGDRMQDARGEAGAGAVKDKLEKGGSDRTKDKPGQGAGSKLPDGRGDGGPAKVKDKAGNTGPAKAKDKDKTPDLKTGSKQVKKPAAKPATSALDVKPKAQVKQQADRGNVSRTSAASHPAAGRSGGGGGGSKGGGRSGGGGGGGGRGR